MGVGGPLEDLEKSVLEKKEVWNENSPSIAI